MMKRIFIITGASRGLGKAFAHSLNSFYNSDSLFILIARDLKALDSVKQAMVSQTPPPSSSSSAINQVLLVSTDFAVPKQVADYVALLKPLLDQFDLTRVEKLTVIYNHGTLEVGSVVTKPINDPLRERFEINLFSSWYLLSAICTLIPFNLIKKQVHVNISSAYARIPTAEWSAHCSTRAARESVFKCFALEQPESIKVLNFFPGLVQTDMLQQSVDVMPELNETYTKSGIAKPEEVAERLTRVLDQDEFESGADVKFRQGPDSH